MKEKSSGFRKRTKILIAVASILILALLAGGTYYFMSKKSARQSFLDAESRNFKNLSRQLKEAYKKMTDARQPYLTGSYKSRTEITADIKPGNGAVAASGTAAADSDDFNLYDLIGKFKLIVDTNQNPIDKTGFVKLSLLLEKTPFIDANIYTRGHEMFFTVPVLTPDSYFSVDTDKLDEVYDKFKIPVRPRRISRLFDPMSVLYFNDQEFDKIASEYGSIISNALGESDVHFGEKIEMDISGEKLKGREILVTPSADSSDSFFKSLVGKASSDDMLIKLTYGNFAALSGVIDEAGIYQLLDYLDKTGNMGLSKTERDFLNVLASYKDLQGFKKALGEAMNGYTAENGLKLKLVVDGQGNILDQRLTASLMNSGSRMAYDVVLHTGTNSIKYNDFRNRFMDASVIETTPEGIKFRYYLKVDPALEPAEEGNKGTLKIGFGLEKDGVVQSGVNAAFELAPGIDRLTSKKNVKTGYSIDMLSVGVKGSDSLKGDINTTSWKNNKLKTKNSTTAITINANLPSFNVKDYSIALNLAREDRLGLEPYKLPEINAKSIVNLNTASEEELKMVENDILSSFGTFYLANKPIVDAVLGR